MTGKLKIELYKLLSALSLAMDYNRRGLMRHHQRVALISMSIASEMGISGDDILRLYCSAIVHDAGTSTFREKESLEHFEVNNPWEHCKRGYTLLRKSKILVPLTEIILHHHDRWDGRDNPSGLKGASIPLPSRIIFLADRVDVLAQRPGNILDYREEIVKKIAGEAGAMFDPDLVDIFVRLSRKEHFWLDLTSQFIETILIRRMGACPVIASREEITGISRIFADVIDGKSPFTYRHSRLVAEVAAFLSAKAGFDSEQQKKMYIAGLLHDLGKLSIPEEIIEKPSGLTTVEYNLIKQHTYITYQIFDMLDGFDDIKEWASYHHEKMNGEGYPFRLRGEELSTGSRIMAIADIFSALFEDRPYRKGLPRDKIEKILTGMAKSGLQDPDIVQLLIDNYSEVAKLKEKIMTNGDEDIEKQVDA